MVSFQGSFEVNGNQLHLQLCITRMQPRVSTLPSYCAWRNSCTCLSASAWIWPSSYVTSPNEVNLSEVQNHVEQLAELMQEGTPVSYVRLMPQLDSFHVVPGQRYVLTLQLMLRRSKRRKSISMSPQSNTPLQVRTNVPIDPALRMQPLHSAGPSSSATYPYPYQPQQTQMQGMMGQPSYIPRENWNEDDVLRELAHLPAERVPFWASDSNAVGSSVPAGAIPLDSYLLPNFYGMKDMDPPPRVF